MEIVLEDDDEVTIETTPLSCKSPTIVDYKIYKEGKKSYFKIIRADGNSQNYLTFRIMFKNFNREDLDVLRSIIKTRFEKIKPPITAKNKANHTAGPKGTNNSKGTQDDFDARNSDMEANHA
nr:hypothetical protein [Tanacetum cinerariifolium]